MVKVSNTVTASQSKNGMTLKTDPTVTQATSQPEASGSSAPSATQIEDMLKTARQQGSSTPQANGNPNKNTVEPEESDSGRH